MTLNNSIDILNTHILCIKRQDTPFCDKNNCEKCNVFIPNDDLIRANQSAIKILSQIKKMKIDDEN